jgi:hypothetical protein
MGQGTSQVGSVLISIIPLACTGVELVSKESAPGTIFRLAYFKKKIFFLTASVIKQS